MGLFYIGMLQRAAWWCSSLIQYKIVYPCFTSTIVAKGWQFGTANRVIFLLGNVRGSMYRTASGLVGDIGRHTVSEKRRAAPLHMQGKAHPHTAYAVMLCLSPRQKSNLL